MSDEFVVYVLLVQKPEGDENGSTLGPFISLNSNLNEIVKELKIEMKFRPHRKYEVWSFRNDGIAVDNLNIHQLLTS